MTSGTSLGPVGTNDPPERYTAALAAALRSGRAPNPPRTLLVTSAHRREGTTTVAVEIASSLTGDRRVLLVDANLRAPALHLRCGTSLSPGLADVLADGLAPRDVVRAAGTDLSILPSGVAYGGAIGSLLTSARLEECLGALRGEYDTIVIDSPPGLDYADPVVLARRCDAVVVVVESGRTRWEVAGELKARLEKAGTPILGIVLNRKRLSVPEWIYRRV